MDILNHVVTAVNLAGNKVHFVELELHQEYNQHHHCIITIDYEELDSKWLTNPVKLLKLIGESVIVEMKHSVTGEPNLFDGIIRNVTFSGKHGTQNYAVIQAAGETIRLEDKPTMYSFLNKTLYEIVKETVEKLGNGAEIVIKPRYNEPIEYMAMYEESVFDFLNRLSYLYGENFFYDGTTIYFGTDNLPQISYPVMYDAEMTEYKLQSNLLPSMFSKYKFLYYDDEERSKPTKEKLPDATGYLSVLFEKSKETYSGKSNSPLYPNVNYSHTIQKMAEIEQLRDVSDMLVLNGSTYTCKVGIGRTIEVDFPKSMEIDTTAGNFLVTQVSHYVNQKGEYYNQFSATRAALEYVSVHNKVRHPKASSERAIVVNNLDPDGLGRIMVQFQWQKDIHQTTKWIRVQSPSAGGTDKVMKNRGIVFIPEIGDEVMVNYENNDPSLPYCSGSMYSVKTGEGGGNANASKSITTRSGIRIDFNDNIGSLHIEDPSGNTWDMDGNGNIKVFSPQNIHLSAGNNIHLSAANDLTMSIGNDLTTTVGNRALFNIMQSMQINTNTMRQLITQSYYLQSNKSLFKIEDEVKIEGKEAYFSGAQKLFLHSDTLATLNSKGIASMKGDTKNTFDNVGEVYEAAANEITAKVIVHFRPKADWKGDFGFDWMRLSDTNWMGGSPMFGDSKPYKDIVGIQYDDNAKTIVSTNINTYTTHFKPDDTIYNNLKTKYDPHTIPWKIKKDTSGTEMTDASGNKIPEDYFTSWISLYPFQTVEVRLCIEVVEDVDEIKLISNSNSIVPSKKELGAFAVGKHEVIIKIECTGELSADTSILVESYKKDAAGTLQLMGKSGKLNIWSNDASKQKSRKVVFISVVADASKPKIDTSDEKTRVNQYLNQALIELAPNSNRIELPIATNPDFTNTFLDAASGKVKRNNGLTGTTIKHLIDMLKAALKTQEGDTYDDYFKAFYFNREGIDSSGYSRFGSDFVVVFEKSNDQTASHEFLHSLNLPHTFSNKQASSYAFCTYEYNQTDNLMDYSHHTSKNGRKSLYYWQWEEANAACPDLAPPRYPKLEPEHLLATPANPVNPPKIPKK
jgi:Uncharacterized protein conserved in bacteria